MRSTPPPRAHGTAGRWLRRSVLVVLGVLGSAVLALTWPRVDSRTLPGLRVAGEPVARGDDPRAELSRRAERFAQSFEVEVKLGRYVVRAKPAQLGAALVVEPMAARLLGYGRSGDPFRDLPAVASALAGGHDFPWVPSVDRLALGAFVRAVRRRVERPPIAGTVDELGGSIPGEPGVSFDTVALQALLEQALRTGQRRVELPLRDVPAPEAIAIGSPDAALYDEDPGSDVAIAVSGDAAQHEQARAAAEGRVQEWAADLGPQCDLAPPYERFCEGPRRVPAPFGAAAELAERLGLGESRTVGHLLRAKPSEAWREAAGQATDGRLLWPVPGGHLWRGFGYVRKAELKHLLHRGVDIGAPKGTPVRASAAGIVAYADNRIRGYGNLLVLIHPEGAVTLYAHCSAVYVFAGQRVARGQVVAAVGDTGLARGKHVHFEYHHAGEPSDPATLFDDGP
jgi:murein DD-endopeptidase MepM/ murein hydrolase activator NlpD